MGTSGEGTKSQCKVFNSKLVGITDVASPEGRDMCAEALRKLKVQCTSSWVMLIHELESKLKFIFCHNGNYKLCYISKTWQL